MVIERLFELGNDERAHQVRQQTQSAERVNSRLSGLRLLLAVDVGDKGDVDEREVVVSDAELKLAHSFDEGSGFDVADCATELWGM